MGLSVLHTLIARVIPFRDWKTMVLMAGMELPIKAIREQISSAVNIIVHQSRLKDGSRKITHVTEVQGMEGDSITLQDIFVFKQESIAEDGHVIGNYMSTGLRPRCLEKFKQYGLTYSMPGG